MFILLLSEKGKDHSERDSFLLTSVLGFVEFPFLSQSLDLYFYP